MNTTADWDVLWRWQWFRRDLWLPHFRDPAHPEGRPARSCPVWTWILQRCEARRVLDCHCGLGLKTILLREAGFDTVGVDASAVAIQHARELAAELGLPVRFHHLGCESLGEQFGAVFDAVVSDAFAFILDREGLRAAARGIAAVLKPGGSLIFAGADQWSHPEQRPGLIEQAWRAAPRFQLRAWYERDSTQMSLIVARDKTDWGIVDNYLFAVRDSGGAHLETAAICNSVEWTWQDYVDVCRGAGFASLESVRIPVGQREHILNVARR